MRISTKRKKVLKKKTEILELKNTLTELKTNEGFSNRQKKNQPEERSFKIVKSEEKQKEKTE